MPIPERVSGAIVDVDRVRAERARCKRLVFYQLPSRTRPAAAQAPTPPRWSGPPSCPVCALPGRALPWGEVRCPVCQRLLT